MRVLMMLFALQGGGWEPAPPLPIPVSNNAVAGLVTTRGPTVYSFMGLDSTKRWDGVHARAFAWTVGEPAWRELPPVPGPGRLAGTAQAVGGRVYVIGGYTVADDGSERSVPDVNIWDPATETWTRGSDIPVPADDAVSGVWRDSLIYLVSGWHDEANIPDVQLYDPAAGVWRQATPISGPPVFGHAGGIIGDAIVYVDGVRMERHPRRFEIEESSWRGRINPADPTDITWEPMDNHPGPPLYRAGAVPLPPDARAPEGRLLLGGGTDNPYNYTGVGYNGFPSRPNRALVGWHPDRRQWRAQGRLPVPLMDLRGIVRVGDVLVLAGGMEADQRVTARVWTRRF